LNENTPLLNLVPFVTMATPVVHLRPIVQPQEPRRFFYFLQLVACGAEHCDRFDSIDFGLYDQ